MEMNSNGMRQMLMLLYSLLLCKRRRRRWLREVVDAVGEERGLGRRVWGSLNRKGKILPKLRVGSEFKKHLHFHQSTLSKVIC